MKYSLGISNFLEEKSCLSHSIVFLYFFVLIAEEGFLISPGYSLELCIQMAMSFLFYFAFCFSSFHSYFKASSDSHFAFFSSETRCTQKHDGNVRIHVIHYSLLTEMGDNPHIPDWNEQAEIQPWCKLLWTAGTGTCNVTDGLHMHQAKWDGLDAKVCVLYYPVHGICKGKTIQWKDHCLPDHMERADSKEAWRIIFDIM